MRREMSRYVGWVAVGAIVAAAFAARAAAAESPSQLDLPIFGARAIAVPVFVTDKSGDPVVGLAAAEFEVEDRGKKVPSFVLRSVDVGRAMDGEAGALMQAAARRQFVFLFDLIFSTPTAMVKAREMARGFVRESLSATDLVAVAINDPKGIRFLVGFTSDRGQIDRAIDSLGLSEPQRPRDHLNLIFEFPAPPSVAAASNPAGSPDGTLDHLRALSAEMAGAERGVYGQLAGSFQGGLRNMARMLDSVQGRKQVVLLSAGFDPSVQGAAQGVSGEKTDDEGDNPLYFEEVDPGGPRSAFARIDRIAADFALSDTVVHAVDVMALAGGGNSEEALPVRFGQGREVLVRLARGSGGRFFKNPSGFRGELEDVLRASRSYYLLAFEPAGLGKKEGPRKLRVRVKRDGVEVAHRGAYLPPDPARPLDPVARRIQASEVIAKGIAGGPLGLRVLAVPYRGTDGRLALPLVLDVDGRSLLAGKPGKELRLEIYVYAFDAEGRIQDSLGFMPTLDLGAVKGQLEAKGLQLLTSLAVAKGQADLRVLVRDTVSNRSGSLETRLEIPAFGAERVVLSPPLAMDDPRARLVIPAASRGNPRLEIPFRLGDEPFTAETVPMLRNGAARRFCLLVWSGTSQPRTDLEFEVAAELVDASGSAHHLSLPGAPRRVSDADGFQRFVVDLEPKDLPPGPYSLRMSLSDRERGTVAQSEIPVQVN